MVTLNTVSLVSLIGSIPNEYIKDIIVLLIFQEHTGRIYASYIKRIKETNKIVRGICFIALIQINNTFINSLNIIPNGVLLINKASQAVAFANKEIMSILQATKFSNIKQKAIDFFTHELDYSQKSGENQLWHYLTTGIQSSKDVKIEDDKVFKSKNPKRYIQVKTSLINNDQHVIAICSDITRIKELEHTSMKMRAMYFSSIAHELRTPLNSIIPILKMIL